MFHQQRSHSTPRDERRTRTTERERKTRRRHISTYDISLPKNALSCYKCTGLMLRLVLATDEKDGTSWVLPDPAGIYPARIKIAAQEVTCFKKKCITEHAKFDSWCIGRFFFLLFPFLPLDTVPIHGSWNHHSVQFTTRLALHYHIIITDINDQLAWMLIYKKLTWALFAGTGSVCGPNTCRNRSTHEAGSVHHNTSLT